MPYALYKNTMCAAALDKMRTTGLIRGSALSQDDVEAGCAGQADQDLGGSGGMGGMGGAMGTIGRERSVAGTCG